MASASSGSSRTITSRIRVVGEDATNAAFASVEGRLRRLSRTADDATRQMEHASRASITAAATGAARFTQGAVGFGRQIGALSGAYLGGRLIKDAITDFAAMDRQLSRIGITAGASREQMNTARTSIRQIADATGHATSEITEGLQALVVSGMDFDTAMAKLPDMAIANRAMSADMAETADTATVLMKNMKIAPEQLGKAFDMMAKGADMGKFEAKDFATFLPQLGAAAARAGMTGVDGLAKLVAMLEIVREQSGTSGEAVTGMRDMIAKSGSEQMEENFAKWSVNLKSMMNQTRREGGDQIDTFLAATDMVLQRMAEAEQLPQSARFSLLEKLFPEADSRRTVAALLTTRQAAV